MRKILAVLVISATAAVLLSLLAEASHRVVKDPDDSPTRLDVRRVDVGEPRWRPRWRIWTWQPWKTRRIRDTGFFVLKLDTFGSRRPDYYVLIRSTGDEMRATLFRDREDEPDRFIARLEVWRPTRKSVAVRVPLRKTYIPDKRTFIRWAVVTLDNGTCPHVCLDRAPDSGLVRELVRVEPSPSPSDTPSPLPTLIAN